MRSTARVSIFLFIVVPPLIAAKDPGDLRLAIFKDSPKV